MFFTKTLRRLISALRFRKAARKKLAIKRSFAVMEGLEERTLLSIGLGNHPLLSSEVQTAPLSPLGSVNQATTANASASQTTTLNNLPAQERYAISSSIGADQPQYLAVQTTTGFNLTNSPNSYTAALGRGGMTLSTGADTWSMNLLSYGHGTSQTLISPGTPEAHGNKVSYSHESISDWYVNGPLGLQQGFTVAQRPAGNQSDPLTVSVALSGSLKAGLQADAQGLTLTRPDGTTALTYSGLVAYDATGKQLDASLALQPDGVGQDLVFRVNDTNARYPLTIDPVTQTAKLTAGDGAANDQFGYSVSLSSDGNTAIIGAPSVTVGTNAQQGSAYIYTKPVGGWANTSTYSAKLTTADGHTSDYFGQSVSLSADGSTALVSAYYATVGANGNEGAVYVFSRPGGGWSTTSSPSAKLTPSDGVYGSVFGQCVMISGDGSTAVIGAAGWAASSGSAASKGSAYVYQKPGSGWTTTSSYTAKLTSSTSANGDRFGWAVATSNDGSTILVGATLVTNHSGSQQGAGYLFVKPNTGWASTSSALQLTTSDGSGQHNGTSVALSSDGNTALVGPGGGSTINGVFQSAGYIYVKPTTGWAAMTETAELQNSDQSMYSATLSPDGNRAVLGITNSAYIYNKPNAGWQTTSTYNDVITATGIPGGAQRVSLNSDGSTALIGNYGATVGSNSGQGEAYLNTLPTLPSITAQPANASVTNGTTATFLATATGTPSPTVQWQVSTNGGNTWTDINGATSSSYSLTTAATDSGKLYHAVFTNSMGSVSSSAARLQVSGIATTTVLSSSTLSALYGQSVTLTATVSTVPTNSGTPTGTVQFLLDGSNFGSPVALSSGVATLNAGLIPVGDHQMSATYSGATAFYASSSAFIQTVAGTGTAGFSGDGGPATSATLHSPCDVVIDGDGNLFFADADNQRIREVVKATGNIITIAGTGTAGYSGEGGPATAAKLNTPVGLAFDSAGNLFIADHNNNRIREIVKATGNIITVAGNGTGAYSGDGSAASAASLFGPNGVAFDASGNLFIADQANNRIREIVKATGNIVTVAGNGTAGFSGDGAAATAAKLSVPIGLTIDSAGNLFIADLANNRIREIVKATGNIITVAGNGPASFNGDGGAATSASLNSPYKVITDGTGNLFIVDQNNNRVRKVDQATGVITTVAGNGTAGYTGDGGPAGNATLYIPLGMCFDSTGNLYIGDYGNQAIRKVTSSTTLHIGAASTVTNLSLSNATAPVGQTVTFTTTVSAVAPSTATPTGTMQFVVDGVNYANPVTLNGSGSASLDTASLSVGSHAVSVKYTASSGNFNGSTSGSSTQVILQTTSTTLATSSPSAVYGQPVTFTATVTSGATGTVTFKDGTTTLGTVTISGTSAALTTTSLSKGSHSITAVYGGDANYATSTSSSLSQNISGLLQVGYMVLGNAGSYQVPLNGASSFSAASVSAGALPSGLSLNSSGLISGTPAAGTLGNYSLTVNVTPSGGSAYDQPLTLTVLANQFVDPDYSPGDGFGSSIVVLTGGNVVVTAPYDDAGGTDAGAVYLFNGFTGALISTLKGSTAYENVGYYGITALSNGNYVVSSPYWSSSKGAVTWGSGTAGISGTVSSANSLVGSTAGDYVGYNGVTALSNGNYLVRSSNWSSSKGAVTWGSGTAGITGTVSSANSLVGSTANDSVGNYVISLANGNYVVSSYNWSSYKGAVTWGNGTVGISGTISSANSLVGSTANDYVGLNGITALSNGNYVVRSTVWDNGTATDAGAATWGSGTAGISGTVSSANSLVGSTAYDHVGYNGVTALSNGNYLVGSPNWSSQKGAVTWGSGAAGISGTVSSANSLVGSTANDYVGLYGITALTNGNYVVSSPSWSSSKGAVTWGSGTAGISGTVSNANSLVGSTAYDSVGLYGITALSNGNYVVSSSSWSSSKGAVTWGSGTAGISGTVSSANSLVGSTANDSVGNYGIRALYNGNYVVSSPYWDNGAATDAGAVTWGSGTAGIKGTVSNANSLVGSTANDYVGLNGITALSNGNYVVISTLWDNGTATDAGAATWGSGTAGISGTVSSANSLVGSSANDMVGSYGVTALFNGNYVVSSPSWSSSKGAVTWGSGTAGISGTVSSANSLVGATANDYVGLNGITALSNGNYLVQSGAYQNGTVTNAGAVTWGSGTAGISGTVSGLNSLIGPFQSISPTINTVTNTFMMAMRSPSVLATGSLCQPTTTTLASSANASTYGNNVTFTATVTSGATGTVTFKDGTTTLGTVTISGTSATFSTATLTGGSHSITAVYGGDTNYATSTSAVTTQVVNTASTTTNLASSANPSTYGTSVTFTATVTANSPSTGVPTGSLQFQVDGVNSGSPVVLVYGMATLVTSTLSGGSHTVTSLYLGDGLNFTGSSASVSQQITTQNQATTSTVTISSTSTVFGQAVTFSASVTAASGSPTGTVQFQVDGVNYGSPVTLVNGVASISDSALSVGPHKISAAYTSNTQNFQGSTGQANSLGTLINTVAGNGNFGNGGDGAQGTNANLSYVEGIATDSAGNLYLADPQNHVVRELIKATGIIITVAGSGTAGYTGDGSAATAATLTGPEGVFVDSTGNLFIADTGNNVIREVVKATGKIITVAGNGTAGYTGDGAVATSAELDHPLSVVADTAGNLFIADTSNNVVREVLASGGLISTVAGSGTAGYTGDGDAATAASLYYPVGLAINGSGTLFIADAGNNVVRQVSAGMITTFAGNGLSGSAGDGGPASLAQLNQPIALALDADGNLYVTDARNNLVREVTASDGSINTVAGNGSPGYTGDGGQSTDATLSYPSGVAIDPQGTIYLADTNNSVVRALTNPSLVVSPATTTTTLSSSASTATYGQVVTLTATVAVAAPSQASATGTVQFVVNGQPYGSPVALSGGQASLAVSGLNAGTFFVSASYLGDGQNISGSVSVNFRQRVNPAALTITANDQSKTYGTALSLGTTAFTVSGLKYADTVTSVSLSSAGAAATATVGSYPITPSAASGSFNSNNYTVTYNAGTLTVGKAHLTVTADAKSKTYDGQVFTAFTAGVTGFVNGETSSVVSGSASFSGTATTAVNAGTYTITPAAGTLSATNYDFATFNPGTLTINKAHLTVTADAKSKTYDGLVFTAFTASVTGFVNGETSSVVSGSASFGGTATTAVNAGTYIITPAAGTLSATNYDFATFNAGTLTINKAHLTVTADAKSKTYDGQVFAAFTAGVTGFVNGESSSVVSGSASFSGTATTAVNAGTYTITPAAGTLSATNYDFATFNPGTLTINKAHLTVTADAKNKTYDGQVFTAFTAGVTGFVNGESSSVVSGSASFSGTATTAVNAGTYTITPAAGTLSATNYDFATFNAGTLTINPKALTLTFVGAPTKVYDGTTTVTLTPANFSLSGLAGAESFSVTRTSGNFADKNVSASQSITVALATIDYTAGAGTLAANYILPTSTTGAGSITQRTLVISASAQNKVYDGTTLATVALSDNRVIGDSLTATYQSAAFPDKNAGYKIVTITGISLSGADAGNYSFNTKATAPANIALRPVTAVVTVSDKTYDATTAAVITGRSLSGVLSGETVTLTGGLASFADKNVGSGKTVTTTGLRLSGSSSGNYTLDTTTAVTSTAGINPFALSITVTGINKLYDGNTTATVALSDNRVSGDVFTYGTPTASFADPNVGNAKPVSVTGILISGTDAGNYTYSTTASTTADISLGSTAPVVTSNPVSQTVLPGAAVSLSATASGTPVPDVQWQVSTNKGVTWTNITGATSTTYSFTAALADTGKQFRAVFTSTAGSAVTSAATLTVNAAQVSRVDVQWGTAGTATLSDAVGGRLLPTGRANDIPWLNINRITVTFNHAVTSLSPSDITVGGISVSNYGPVTVAPVSGTNGTAWIITLAKAIADPDRVTVTLSNSQMSTYQRRLDVLPGDVNDDGIVNAQDVTVVRNQVLGLIPPTIPLTFMDIDGNGFIDSTDLTLVASRNGKKLP